MENLNLPNFETVDFDPFNLIWSHKLNEKQIRLWLELNPNKLSYNLTLNNLQQIRLFNNENVTWKNLF